MNLHFTYISPAVARLLGYTVDQAMEVPLEKMMMPASCQSVYEHFADQLVIEQSGEADPLRSATLELEEVRADGSIVPVEVHAQFLRDSDGKPYGLIGITRDITARKKAMDELERLKRQNEMILKSAGEAIIGLDADGKHSFINPMAAEWLGYEESDLIGKESHLVWHHAKTDGQPYPPDECPILNTLRTGAPVVALRDIFRRKTGECFPVEFTCTPIMEKEKVAGAVVVFKDISERLQAEEKHRLMEAQLNHQQKLESIGTLAGGVAHEINNPISAILSFAELIHDRLPPEDRLSDFASRIITETVRVANIVKNLLSFAREQKEHHSPARMTDIVDSTLSLIRSVLTKEQVRLVVDIPPDLPKIKCRTHQIQQVVMNLLTNARDALNERFSGAEGQKKLSIVSQLIDTEAGPAVRTVIEDNGSGIDPEIIGRIFDPFFTTKPRETGTGLGLSISHGIVKEHRGSLTVESKRGEYTRFYMDLPVDNGWTSGTLPSADARGD